MLVFIGMIRMSIVAELFVSGFLSFFCIRVVEENLVWLRVAGRCRRRFEVLIIFVNRFGCGSWSSSGKRGRTTVCSEFLRNYQIL